MKAETRLFLNAFHCLPFDPGSVQDGAVCQGPETGSIGLAHGPFFQGDTGSPWRELAFFTGPLPPALQQRAVIPWACNSQRRLEGNRVVKLGISQWLIVLKAWRDQRTLDYWSSRVIFLLLLPLPLSALCSGAVDLHPKSISCCFHGH